MSVAGMAIRLAERLPILRGATLSLERKMYNHHVQRVRREAGERAHAATGGIVASGLFCGLKLDKFTSWGSDQLSTITGQYERELHAVIGRACELDYDRYLDIGCANGIYAVGVARLAPRATVIAFDIDDAARLATTRNARLNGVEERVLVEGLASPQSLASYIRQGGRCFVIVDIEGAELELIDPATCPDLATTDLLIELHGDIPEAISEFKRRFGATHAAYVISRQARSPFEQHCGAFASEDDAWIAVSEGRGFTRDNWLFLVRTGALASFETALASDHVRKV
jgi:SAM-dependent methyltransferase